MGRTDPNSFTDGTPIMTHPSALALDGNKLWVVDRGKGLLVFTIPGLPSTTAQAPAP